MKRWIMYWNNTFDVWSIAIKIIMSTFCIWPSSHIIIYIIYHLITLHSLWSMDETYRFNTLAMGRIINSVVKDFIEKSPTTWTISYYWWNKPSFIWDTYSTTSTTWNGWWRKIWSCKNLGFTSFWSTFGIPNVLAWIQC